MTLQGDTKTCSSLVSHRHCDGVSTVTEAFRASPPSRGSERKRGSVISPDFSLELTGFFPGKHLIQFLVLKMKDFRNFVLDNCILDFDAEQVYLKPQVINLKNKEVTVNPKPKP